MSVSRGCAYVEEKPGKWFLAVAHEEYEYTLNVWTAECVGPFGTKEEVDEYLDANFSNPGGANIYRYSPDFNLSDDMRQLVEEATPPSQPKYRRW